MQAPNLDSANAELAKPKFNSGAQAKAENPSKNMPARDLDSDYVKLAKLISNSLATEGKPGSISASPDEAENTLKALASSPSATIRNAVGRIHAGRDAAFQEQQTVSQGADEAGRLFGDVANRADQSVEREEVITNPDGTTTTKRVTEQVDDSFSVLGALLMESWVRSKAPEAARNRANVALERGRIDTWDEMLPRLDEFYGSAVDRADVITPQVEVPTKDGNAGKFTLLNSSGQELTNVTVKLDLIHFLSWPQPLARHVYFFEKWPAGESIKLPSGFVPNVANANYLAGRPIHAIPAYAWAKQTFRREPPASELWLKGVGGVVEFRIAAWSMGLRQSERPVKIPELVELAGRYEMDYAFRDSSNMYLNAYLHELVKALGREPTDKSPLPTGIDTIPPEGFKAPYLTRPHWCLQAAKRVAEFAPVESDIHREATKYATDPNEYVRARIIRSFEGNIALVQPGSQWTGEWSFELLSVPGLSEEVAQALNDFKGKKGPIHFIVDSLDKSAYTLTGRLVDGTDNMSRPVTGLITVQGVTIRAPATKKSRIVPILDLHDAPVIFKMTREGNDLVGTGETFGDAFGKNYYYNLWLSLTKE
jgi:hypothetical protein